MHSYISRYSVLAYSIKVSWRFAECLSRVSEGFRGFPRGSEGFPTGITCSLSNHDFDNDSSDSEIRGG